MTARIKADLCIIGAGSGGLSVAAGAAQMGARVVLVEGAAMGGDCLNVGCVPSKALLAAAARAQTVRAGGMGVAGMEPQVDYAAAMAHVSATIATIAPHDSQQRFEGLGVQVIRAWGRFVGPDALEAGGVLIAARRFVIATGSRPAVPGIPGLKGVPFLTNETLWALRELPEHLLVLGGGPLGMEMAQAHRRLGARVTVLDGGAALGRDDPEAAAVVLAALRAEGVEIVERVEITRAAGRAGAIALQAGDGRVFEGSHLLVATGRVPNVERLNLPAAGVRSDARGVLTDSRLRSSNRRIFAIGDIAGRGQFTHLAGYHAGLVVRQALFGLPARLRDDHIPRATYTDPGLAQVGLTEAEARKQHGDRITVVKVPVSGNDRALAQGHRDGFVKLIVHRGRALGVTIAAPEAGEIIAPFVLGIAARLKLSAYTSAVYPYPTLSELSKRAASAYFSPKLFENPWVKRGVRLTQRLLP